MNIRKKREVAPIFSLKRISGSGRYAPCYEDQNWMQRVLFMMIRGIEKGTIFLSRMDRDDLLLRFSLILPKSGRHLYALRKRDWRIQDFFK